jgi:uncharacterized YccA/Bax inhibitor family protein
MSNPVFNEESFKRPLSSTAAGPPAPGRPGGALPPQGHVATQPVSDGPVSGWQKAMTINGTITASMVLLVLLLVSASFGWSAASGPPT